jgi:DNA polymerase III subunit epsilon
MTAMTNHAFPWIDRPIAELPFVFLDVETTGFDARKAGVTELALLAPWFASRPRFTTLVDPERPIPPDTIRLNGIDAEMVRGAPPMAKLLPDLAEVFSQGIFTAHNVPFDWSFFDVAWQSHFGKPLSMPSLCTLRLARKYLHLGSNKLTDVAAHFGLALEQAHRALHDTMVVAGIIERFVPILAEHGIKTGRDLLAHGLLHPERPPVRRF